MLCPMRYVNPSKYLRLSALNFWFVRHFVCLVYYSETSIKRTLSQVAKLTSYISLYNEPLFSGHLYFILSGHRTELTIV